MIDEKGTFARKDYVKQRNYANFTITSIQNLLSNFNHFLIMILKESTIIDMVEVIETFEDAQLLREISSCNEFSMRGVRDRRPNRVSLLTMFDNRKEEEYLFG